jgi:hypothetical protein
MQAQLIAGKAYCPSDENRARIRNILIREWDPIGVRQIPGAPEDEYDRYIDDICELLSDPRPSKEKVAAYLLDIQSRKMLLRVTPAALERCNRAADSLMATVMESSP